MKSKIKPKVIVPFFLPKGYLSYSAVMLWQKDKAAFRRKYYEFEEDLSNVYMTFGKKIAKFLESRDYEKYPTLKKVPYYPVSEHAITVTIGRTKQNPYGVQVKGFLDLYDDRECAFAEIKTGIVSAKNGPPWNKLKVQAHDQLPWYSMLIQESEGRIKENCKLIWIETRYKKRKEKLGSQVMECEGNELELTGKIKTFNRKIEQWERDRMKKLIIKVAKEISDDFKKYQKVVIK